MMVFPITLPCKGLVYSPEIVGRTGGEQLSSVNLIFSKKQIEYMCRKSFAELQSFNRKSWEIALDAGHWVL